MRQTVCDHLWGHMWLVFLWRPYLRMLLCDKNEAVVIDEIAVDVLSAGSIKIITIENVIREGLKLKAWVWIFAPLCEVLLPRCHSWCYIFHPGPCTVQKIIVILHLYGELIPLWMWVCTCLQAVQNFLWKNSSFIWIPTAERKIHNENRSE